MTRLLTILLAAAVAKAAATPDAAYLAHRDREIAAAKAAGPAWSAKREARALAGLERQLKTFIPPPSGPGITGKGTIALQTLTEDLGFGQLDGLAYAAPAKTQIVVTTSALLDAWIASHGDGASKDGLPADRPAAIRSELFYTLAISPDASVARFADLPLAARDGGLLVAMLAQRRQDIAPGPPDEIVGTLVRGDRVFVVSQAVEAKIAPIKPCEDLRRTKKKEAEGLLAAYNAGGSTDGKLFDRYTKAQDAGDLAYRQCFGERFKTQAEAAAVLRQSQALFDGLR